MPESPILCAALWLSATVAAYFGCLAANVFLYKKIRLPIFTCLYAASIILIFAVEACGGDYAQYESSTKLITFLLYPATIALAVPLYKGRAEILRNLRGVAAATVVSSIISVLSVMALAKMFGIEDVLMKSLISKCVTTPVAIEITKMVGGIEGIAVCAVCISGILGAFCGHFILSLLGVKKDISIGLAIGATSHIIGTTECMQRSEKQAAAGAMVLITCALFTAAFAAVLFRLL